MCSTQRGITLLIVFLADSGALNTSHRNIQRKDSPLYQGDYTRSTALVVVACFGVAEKLCGIDNASVSIFSMLSYVFMRIGQSVTPNDLTNLQKTESEIVCKMNLHTMHLNNIRSRAVDLFMNTDLFAFEDPAIVEKAASLTFFIAWSIGIDSVVKDPSSYQISKSLCYVCLACVEQAEKSSMKCISRMQPLTRVLSYRIVRSAASTSPLEMRRMLGGRFSRQETWEYRATSAYTLCTVMAALA
jgi:hypothetical protein